MEANGGELKRDRRKGGGWKKYAGYGVTAFLVMAAVVLLVFIFVRKDEFIDTVARIRKAFAPALYGLVFAYLMNPLMKFFEDKLKNLFHKFAKNIKRADRAARVLSIIFTLILLFFLIGFLMYMLIPELTTTITNLVSDIPEQYRKIEKWYLALEFRNTQVGQIVDKGIMRSGEYIQNFIDKHLTNAEAASETFGPILSGVKNVFGALYSTLYNTFIGLVFSVYLLASKEKFAGIFKKMIYSCMKRKHANTFIRIARQCNVKFTTSFTGKIVDSIIVGMICFLAMTIIRLPYAVLISVIIGVTNVIPFFGPIIGAVPSAILIVCVSPLQCLYFLIMIVVLQQLDANVLTPKIVGDSIGISPIWVLFACVFFGSLWGVLGMLLAVPLMACIYMIVKEIVEYRLYRKGMMLDTDYFEALEYEDETETIRVSAEKVEILVENEPSKDFIIKEEPENTEEPGKQGENDASAENDPAGDTKTHENGIRYTIYSSKAWNGLKKRFRRKGGAGTNAEHPEETDKPGDPDRTGEDKDRFRVLKNGINRLRNRNKDKD